MIKTNSDAVRLKRTTSDSILERLKRLHPKRIDLSLGRIKRLLKALDHPERRLPPVIHVAGTNGKGSVIAYLRAFHEAAGRRVHVYTSPHLVRFTERVVIGGKTIREKEFADLLQICEGANEDAPITFFEITTAAAMLAFATHPADILLLETGLGGRLDATNVVASPALSVITPVSLDHQRFLGTTLAAIAAEKAGILKPGVRAVIGPQPAEASTEIARQARDLDCPLDRFGAEFGAEAVADGLRFRTGDTIISLPRPALLGSHQITNAAVALACLPGLPSLPVEVSDMAVGLRSVCWPARLQHLHWSVAPRPKWEFWLDSGHNPAAGEALGDVARAWRDRPLYLVVGMMENKDARGFLRPLASAADSVVFVPIPGHDTSLAPERLAAIATDLGLTVSTAASVREAIAQLPQAGAARVLICGSAYLAGSVLREME